MCVSLSLSISSSALLYCFSKNIQGAKVCNLCFVTLNRDTLPETFFVAGGFVGPSSPSFSLIHDAGMIPKVVYCICALFIVSRRPRQKNKRKVSSSKNRSNRKEENESEGERQKLVYAFNPPLPALRKSKTAEAGEILLLPRSKRQWISQKKECKEELKSNCFEQNRRSCAIKSKKLCDEISRNSAAGKASGDEKSTNAFAKSKIFGFNGGEEKVNKQWEEREGCENKVFQACTLDLREACLGKANKLCDRAFQ